MSTTHSTPDAPYTIVGSKPSAPRGKHGASAVLLNREARIGRAEALVALRSAGIQDIISVEGPAPHYEIERLSAELPGSRFLLLSRETSTGEQVNLSLNECLNRNVLVIWNTQRVHAIPTDAAQTMQQRELLCVVPTFRTEKAEAIPTLYAPAFYNRLLRLVPSQPLKDNAPTLFPHNYCGIYDRKRFRLVGGYDPAIPNGYWQKLDFGFRSWMWGERISGLRGFEVRMVRDTPPEDATVDESYALFHLKNLAIRFSRDCGKLPTGRFWAFLAHGRRGLSGSIRTFARVRGWVRDNRYRFQQDARRVTELWEVDE